MKKPLSQVLKYFLKLGFTGFGGPLAVIAQIQKELVIEQKWMSEDEFRRGLAMIKTMPGPASTQTIIFVGQSVAGFWGGLLSGLVFILPAFFMMVGLAMSYDQFQKNVWISLLLEGMSAAAFVLILIALKDLTKSYFSKTRFWTFFVIALLSLGGLHIIEPVVIIGLGVLSSIFSRPGQRTLYSVGADVFLISFKAGALAFGTGLTIVPLLQSEFVGTYGLITKEQFMDALTFGQLTPGPVVITVTFIGYKLAGWTGAILATCGIFLPSFFNVLTWFPRMMNWMSQQKWIADFVLGATAALGAAIVLALISLTEQIHLAQIIIPLFLFVVFSKKKIPSWAFILCSGGLHLIFSLVFTH